MATQPSVNMQPLSKSRRWASLVVLLVAMTVLSLDLTIMDIALPSIAQELRPTSDEQLWIVDVYSLALVGLLIPASSLSDRWGRKRTLLVGAVLFCVGSALVVFADAPAQVIAVRAVMGLAAALMMPTTVSAIRNIFTDARERAFALAAWSVVGGAGMALGPVLGGFLLEHFTWHAAFLINIPLMGATFVVGLFVLPEIRVEGQGAWDFPAALMAVAGMILALWSFKRMAATLSVTDPMLLAAFAAGVALLIAFVVRCARSESPLIDVSLFKSRAFCAGIVAALGAMFAMAGVLLMLSQWLQLVQGNSPLEAGVLMLPMAIASLVGGGVAPTLALRVGARPVMAGGLAIGGAAMASLFFVGPDVTYPVIAVVMVLVGLGTGALAVGSAAIMCATPAEKASSSAALEEIAYDLANVLGVAIVGSVASIIYRAGFSVEALQAMGLDAASIASALDSYGGAVSVAAQTGATELVAMGGAAFSDAFVMSIVVGGVIMLAVALVVWLVAPAGLKISEDQEDAGAQA